jgi:hypothetical protein
MPPQIPNISPPLLECGTRRAKIHSVRMPHHLFFKFFLFSENPLHKCSLCIVHIGRQQPLLPVLVRHGWRGCLKSSRWGDSVTMLYLAKAFGVYNTPKTRKYMDIFTINDPDICSLSKRPDCQGSVSWGTVHKGMHGLRTWTSCCFWADFRINDSYFRQSILTFNGAYIDTIPYSHCLGVHGHILLQRTVLQLLHTNTYDISWYIYIYIYTYI